MKKHLALALAVAALSLPVSARSEMCLDNMTGRSFPCTAFPPRSDWPEKHERNYGPSRKEREADREYQSRLADWNDCQRSRGSAAFQVDPGMICGPAPSPPR